MEFRIGNSWEMEPNKALCPTGTGRHGSGQLTLERSGKPLGSGMSGLIRKNTHVEPSLESAIVPMDKPAKVSAECVGFTG